MKHRETKKLYAAKYLKDILNPKNLVAIVREVYILKKLTEMKGANVFSTKLRDLVIAGEEGSFKSIFW